MSTPHTRVAAILIDQNRLLTMRRERSDRPVYFTIPGGTVNSGESRVEALEREILEECNVRISNITLILELDLPQGDEYFYTATIASNQLDVRIVGPEAHSSPDNRYSLQWVSWADLKNLPLLPPELHTHLLQHPEYFVSS